MRPPSNIPRAPQRQVGPLVGEGGGEQVAGAQVHAHARHQRRRGPARAERRVELASAREG
ncbi:unnamed protein product [Plutella xylostella]|uniref:(diamondback moth) hypothetical protein n=1 Tax=Plutella xylostella TaxID=51655 RepID=A0A8S4D011_PLUXY|nr:unnamed protein product [Plutella xylostella]